MLSTSWEHAVSSAKPAPTIGMPVPEQPALRLIYDTAPIGLAVLSPDFRYLHVKQRLTEICGISVEGHLGRSVRDRVPGLADAVEDIVRSIMATGEPVTGIEVTGQRADQIEERWWVTYPTKKNINNLQFAPTFNIGLPHRWFLTFYPGPDIRINYGDPITGQTGRLFLSFDAGVEPNCRTMLRCRSISACRSSGAIQFTIRRRRSNST